MESPNIDLREPISDHLSFKDLANVLEKISLADSNAKKKEYLQKYVVFLRKRFKEHYKTLDSEKANGDSLYCVVRILLPDVDRGRKAYGFKSSSLGRMFAQILGLDKTSRDGKSLIEFKDPRRAGSSAGNIASLIHNILDSRFSAKSTESNNGINLSELHETLNKLSKGSSTDVNQEYQKKVLQGLVRKLCPLEGKWLVRILLKEMHLGFSSTKNSVYALLHPQAKVLSERIGDLNLLCQKLNDPSVEVTDINILLFNHFRPMLATRMDLIDSTYESSSISSSDERKAHKSNWGKPEKVSLPPPPFYIETKWDGERFQIHFDGEVFKYYSRRAFDFTNKFNETLSSKLRNQIKPGVHSFILDGEMMAYNKKYKIFTQKGYNIDVKTINKDNPTHCPVFVAFDLVYYNGTVLTKIPLAERRTRLNQIFEAKDDVIRMSEVKVLNSKDEVVETLNSAIDDGEEGLIAKDMNSFYEPGKRPMTWLKIKPEYLEDNSVDDLDLVILGAYYTESTRRGGEITHFLVGLLDTSKGKKEYYPVAKVGSGRLRSVAVKGLVEELRPKFVKSPVSNVVLKGRKKPDFMIQPEKSIVVQVKASEIIPSDVYACQYTLRFPRITKIRKDKSPTEIMEVKEFLRIREACGGKLAKRTDGAIGKSGHPFFKKKRHQSDNEDSDNEDNGPPDRKKSLIAPTSDHEDDETEVPLPGPSKVLMFVNKPKIILAKSPAKTITTSPMKMGSSIMQVSKQSTGTLQNNVFNSKVFCVYGSSSWKTEMEAKIRKCGGDISQSPDVKNLFAIIGERRSSILVRKAIQSNNYNVLQPSWIHQCIEKGESVATVPLDYWAMTKETRALFAEEYDEYGDSYTKENTVEETKEIVNRMLQNEDEEKLVYNTTPDGSPHKLTSASNKKADSSETDDGHHSDSNSSTDFSDNNLMDDLFPDDKDAVGIERNVSCAWSFMSDIKLTFRGSIDITTQSKFEFYGGHVLASEDDPAITHVIICNKGAQSTEDHSRALVVSERWLEDCLTRKEVLDERLYMVN